ncbi:hypothetical protein C5B91_21230, partial [Haloferax sp. Atlit-10N]
LTDSLLPEHDFCNLVEYTTLMALEEVRAKHDEYRRKCREEEEKRLNPSRIGTQFYCEQKVALTEEHGDVETEEKIEGTEQHEKAAEDAVEVSDDELWESLESGARQVVIETRFVSDAAEFYLGGIPDAVVFEDRKPQLIFDRKTTAHPDRLYDNQRIQVWLYGFMLDRLGFDTGELKIAILSHTRDVDLESGKFLQQKVLSDYPEWGVGDHELSEGIVAHIFEYSPIDHLEDL